jgi:hypothetical protein
MTMMTDLFPTLGRPTINSMDMSVQIEARNG